MIERIKSPPWNSSPYFTATGQQRNKKLIRRARSNNNRQSVDWQYNAVSGWQTALSRVTPAIYSDKGNPWKHIISSGTVRILGKTWK